MCNKEYLDIQRYLETEEPIKIPHFYQKKLQAIIRQMLAPNMGDRPTPKEILNNEYCLSVLNSQ